MSKKLTEEEKAIKAEKKEEKRLAKEKEAAAKAEESKSESVSLADAMAEEGKTVDDIGKGNGKTAAEPTEKTETDPDAVKVVKAPKEGSKGEAAWTAFDAAVSNDKITRKDIILNAVEAGVKKGQAESEYSVWRNFLKQEGYWDQLEELRKAAKAA